MEKVNFTDYDMRSKFEFQVYLSNKLSLYDEKSHHDKIQYIKPENQIAGTIIKNEDEVILNLSHALVKSDSAKIIINDSNKVLNDKEFGVLYATTWDGQIQFTIRRYTKIGGSSTNSFNSISYGDTGKYIVTDMSISSQFMLSNAVERVTYGIDMLQEWFLIYTPDMNIQQLKESSLIIDKLNYNGNEISLLVNGSIRNRGNVREKHYFANSNLVVFFEKPETRENSFKLGIQLRNFFELILNKKLGLNKIILNWDKSFLDGFMRPQDERENWYVAQSFLPSHDTKTFVNFDIKYDDIQTEFKFILKRFIECKKLQDFLSTSLTVSQYKMPVVPILLTLCSSIESYLSDAHFSDGKPVKNLRNKLNMVFNGNWSDKKSTKPIIDQIKASRDFYVHGTRSKSVLSEIELISVIETFMDAVRVYILKELGINKK